MIHRIKAYQSKETRKRMEKLEEDEDTFITSESNGILIEEMDIISSSDHTASITQVKKVVTKTINKAKVVKKTSP